jgi:hypothetical protein
MMAWSRSAMARSGSDIAAIFASTAPSSSALSAFSSWMRSFIAARSSSVNPLDLLLVAVVLLAGRGLPLQPSTIVSYGSTDDIFQSALIDSVTLVEIDRSPLVAFKAGVEELVRIWKACALNKGQFYFVLERGGHGDDSIVRPTRMALPFQFLDYLGVGIMDDFAKVGEHFAAPVRKGCDLLVNNFGWVH